MCGKDYPDFVEVNGVPSTFFERWIWPILGLFVVVVCSIAVGCGIAWMSAVEGIEILCEDTKNAWRSK